MRRKYKNFYNYNKNMNKPMTWINQEYSVQILIKNSIKYKD